MKITFLGGGNMAAALIGGLIEQGFAPADIASIDIFPEARARLQSRFGIPTLAAPTAASLAVDVLVLAVKPQQMREACLPLLPHIGGQLVISIAAGLRLADLSRWLGGHQRLVRTMPNTPSMIGAGITGLYAPDAVSQTDRQVAERILQAVGKTVWVDSEAAIDALGAISGSGPAYVFRFIEALQAAAIELGLPTATAETLVLETVLGGARLAAQSGEPASVLRERVSSRGGTTLAALKVMDEAGFMATIAAAARAAERRSVELGDLLGKD